MATITGDRLRALRQEFGLSQEEVAKKIGISRPAYVNYEQGKSRPVRKLKELAALFDASTDYLLGRTDYRKSFTHGLLGKPENFVPLEDGDTVLQQSPKCRVLVHTTKGLPDEAIDDLIAIAEVYKKKYGIK